MAHPLFIAEILIWNAARSTGKLVDLRKLLDLLIGDSGGDGHDGSLFLRHGTASLLLDPDPPLVGL